MARFALTYLRADEKELWYRVSGTSWQETERLVAVGLNRKFLSQLRMNVPVVIRQ